MPRPSSWPSRCWSCAGPASQLRRSSSSTARGRAAPLLGRRVRAVRDPAGHRSRARCSPTRRWGAGCSARRAARCGPRRGPAGRPARLSARPGSAAGAGDRRRAGGRHPPRGPAHCRPQARERWGGSSPELDALAEAVRSRRGRCAGWRGGCSRRPIAAPPPALSDAEELDARALRGAGDARRRARRARPDARRRRAGRAARGSRVPVPAAETGPTRPDDVLLAEPLGDPRPALSGGVRLRPAGGRVPAAGRPRAVPVRRAPLRAGLRARGCGCAPARMRWPRERYLFYSALSRATERRVPRLPQL